MAANSSSSSSSSPVGELSREQLLQNRLDEMRRERQAELKRISRIAAPAVSSGQQALLQLVGGQQQQEQQQQEQQQQQQQQHGQQQQQQQQQRQPATEAGQAILVEVRGLFESRPVSRILQSSSFRTELESLVRYSLAPGRRPAPPTPETPRQQRRQQQQQPEQQQEQQEQQQQQQQPEQQPPAAVSEAEMRQIRHEEFVEEISELLHSQLVTNTLSSGFRSRLERSVRLRAESLQDGGRAAVETLGRLPPSNVVRNDFSHLGIVPPDQQSVSASSDQFMDDAVSLVSAAAAAAAVATTPAADPGVGRQLRQLQKEMGEMRRMMKLALAGQLETQRMIRQEIGAALAGCQPPAAAAARPADGAGRCLVCLRAGADTAVYRCGHLCLCAACACDLRERSGRPTCPVCRAPIADMLRVFQSGVEADDEQVEE